MPSNALIVDDDLDVQLLGKMLLSQHGYDVVAVGSFGELARQPGLLNADLILLDFRLGEFTGLDILDYLYDLRLNTPILLVSSCSKATATHAIQVGKAKGLRMLGFLPKTTLLTGLTAFLKPLRKAPNAPSSGELANAIDDNQLFLEFQPQVDLQRGQVIGVEALVRWQDPRRGVLSPASFVRLAEQSGLMVPLTWRILELAFAQQAQWQAQGWDLNVAINIPAAFIQAEGMLDAFDQLTHHSNVSLNHITLELTESVGIECLGYACHVLEALQNRGCNLALDDFGTGYSSLTQLYRLPFSELKIDGSFVSRIEQDKNALAITLSSIELGKRLGLTVVAEGIETASQYARLVEMGCAVGQGYFIARPLTASAFNTWFDKHLQTVSKEQDQLEAKDARSLQGLLSSDLKSRYAF
ncbi:EAL domain-containing response regulator [Halovibrio sp. HP20-50]|uniref:EAL domain-containing response regulator n=1 Tax=Halovibrio sp. HP20-59 TaxID=3080275 RepID=UPI00294B18C2|nr:EAL domain-containing response regulator [Halovibrio sp. HP20-59]MEA2117967.1 EAL domain-containing response regulator [Halovibrio sp. HP20-59]